MRGHTDYDSLRTETQKLYGSISPIFSPALKEYIYFTAEGFNHIIFKGSRSEREQSSQILRFNLIPRAIKLLKLSTTYQEYEESRQDFIVKSYKRKIRKSKTVYYWGIIAIIDQRKIKVILRKIGDNGQLHFWSIVPAWVTNKHRDIKLFNTMKGNPEED